MTIEAIACSSSYNFGFFMKIKILKYKRETGKSALIHNFFGKHIGYTKEYLEWLELRQQTVPRIMKHKPTNQYGYFLKETYPTGKPTTIVVKLFDGRTYFAPKSEFIELICQAEL
jgi:hypothetical protein